VDRHRDAAAERDHVAVRQLHGRRQRARR
jgi:hypothetical protein